MPDTLTAIDVQLGPNHDSGFYLWPRGQEPVLCQWATQQKSGEPCKVVVRFSRRYAVICRSVEAARHAVARHYSAM